MLHRLVFVLLTLIVVPAMALAQNNSSNSVTLTWTAPGDDSLSGTASQYDIRMSTSAITSSNFGTATRITAGVPAPAAAGTSQSFLVTGLQPSTTYWFAIKTADEVPNWSLISNVVSKTTTALPDVIAPAAIRNLAVGFLWLNWSTALVRPAGAAAR
ncbi:MAG TPA: fibronectin type III domain-containing protein [Candidatus Eisenbacteria bacterium]|nr:fibronectin type III domain-containing protein [Candidatus Eisenbacteria bacterium]